MGCNFFCLSIEGFWMWTGKNFVKKQPWLGWLGEGVGLQPTTNQFVGLEPWTSPTDFHSVAPPSDWGDFRA